MTHMEMIAALVHKLTEGVDVKDYEEAGWGGQWAQHDHGLFWTDANGVPWSAQYIACLGDPITDLTENMAAEQKARATYEHLIAATDDKLAQATLRLLWQREVGHAHTHDSYLYVPGRSVPEYRLEMFAYVYIMLTLV